MLSFEATCKYWETALADFGKELSSGNISVLKNAEWEFSKGKIRVCDPEEDGRKKRCRWIDCHFEARLKNTGAEMIWNFFEQFSLEHGLSDVERWKNNEEMGRYKFVAKDDETSDKFDVSIMLPYEWNPKPAIWLSVWIGARYRNVDLQ